MTGSSTRMTYSTVALLLVLATIETSVTGFTFPSFVEKTSSRISSSARYVSTSPPTTPSKRSKSAEEAFLEFEKSLNNGAGEDYQAATATSLSDSAEEDELTWQARLELLLDPQISDAQRRILLSELLNANEDIRSSVFEALRERKIDPVLTPTGKKLQDATRAVARQISVDILPALAESLRGGNSDETRKLVEELPSVVPKLGGSLLDAISTQARKQLELLQGDLQNPSRIPERIGKQQTLLRQELQNVFSETPVGLAEPEYTVVKKGIDYEIRQYKGYKAAATDMTKPGAATTTVSVEDVTSGGAAFNAIASYIFGANSEQRTMDMTTPVTTTSTGEMRFYLEGDNFPQPVNNQVDETTPLYTKGSVRLIDVPPTCLAVSKFTGFVTDGEVSRQQDALLAALAIDGIELDVPHGSTIPYVVFQYNPPYTIPIVRRNEIAIPVINPNKQNSSDDTTSSIKDEWLVVDETSSQE